MRVPFAAKRTAELIALPFFARRLSMRVVSVIFLFVVSSCLTARPALAETDDDAACRPYFGRACSAALGRWLPSLPRAPRSLVTSTTVVDEIVDPAGPGELRFENLRGVYRGTLFVYGTAGPPKGHAVYDPTHRIAFYDEGCCSWHHVVVASNVPPPPKTIVARSLTGIQTKRGIRLGDSPTAISATYGPAHERAVPGSAGKTLLAYRRVVNHPGVSEPCEASMTFLFERGRLTAMDFDDAC
jgi:hypothetical protein